MRTRGSPSSSSPPLLLGLALLLPPTSLLARGEGALPPHLSRAREAYQRIRGEYQGLREQALRVAPGQPVMALPEAPPAMVELGDASLPALAPEVREALRARILSERDRGYRQWSRLYLPPRRVQLSEPRLEDGRGAWTQACFREWDRPAGRPGGLPTLAALLPPSPRDPGGRALPSRPLGSRLGSGASSPGLARTGPGTPADVPTSGSAAFEARWAELRPDLEDAVVSAREFPVRHVWRRGVRLWSNADHWARILDRGTRVAEAGRSLLEVRRAALSRATDTWLASLGMGSLGPSPGTRAVRPGAGGGVAPGRARDLWDRDYDRHFLTRLPPGIRWAVERRLTGAYFLGAWQAQQAWSGWWQRHPEAPPEAREASHQALRSAKGSLELAAPYRYWIEEEDPGPKLTVRPSPGRDYRSVGKG